MNHLNIKWHQSAITRKLRNLQNDHESIVLWLTGLPCSGKSTIAHSLEQKLFNLGCRVFVLDGDNIRHGLCSDLRFSKADRKENIRRIGEVSKLMLESGFITITAFISPFREDRESLRELFPRGDFFEIYCKASLKTCEARDVKGLYKQARSGEIKNYTGIDSPYDEPERPELIINTEHSSVEESVDQVIQCLIQRRIIKAK